MFRFLKFGWLRLAISFSNAFINDITVLLGNQAAHSTRETRCNAVTDAYIHVLIEKFFLVHLSDLRHVLTGLDVVSVLVHTEI